jgi:hypothetical protein
VGIPRWGGGGWEFVGGGGLALVEQKANNEEGNGQTGRIFVNCSSASCSRSSDWWWVLGKQSNAEKLLAAKC